MWKDHNCIHCDKLFLRYSGQHSCPYCGKMSFRPGDFVHELTVMITDSLNRWGTYKGPAFYAVSGTDKVAELLLDLYTLYEEMYCASPFPQFIAGALKRFLSGYDEIFRKSVTHAAIMVYDNIKYEPRRGELKDYL